MRILLVEDDELLAEKLTQALIQQHYLVDHASDGQAGWDLAESLDYDLILLDWMLPERDGISVCKELRAKGDRTPILLLTAYDSFSQKVTGLDAGADDYVVKPYNLEELLARIRALFRRGEANLLPILEWGNLKLTPSSCEVFYEECSLPLTSKEYALLELFLRNPHRIFSQSALLDHLWSFDEPPSENAVRAHIKSLRRKLKDSGAGDVLETVYGLGYRLRSPDPAQESQPEATPTETKPAQGKTPVLATTNGKLQNQPEIASDLLPTWQRVQSQYLTRVAILAEAAQLLSGNGILSDDLHQKAIREAHTLIGSLGSFELNQAAEIARSIEQLLQLEQQLDPLQVKQLAEHVVSLRQAIEKTTVSIKSEG